MDSICTVRVPDLKIYDPEAILNKVNIPWNSVDSLDAKAIVASRDLFNTWRDNFVKIVNDPNPEELWQSIGPMVDDNLPAGTVNVHVAKITIAQMDNKDQSTLIKAPDPSKPVTPDAQKPTTPPPSGYKYVYNPQTKQYDTVPESYVSAQYSAMWEGVENAEDFEDIKTLAGDDSKELYANIQGFYDSLYELPHVITAELTPELNEAFQSADIDPNMDVGVYAAMDMLNQLKNEGQIILTRSIAQKPAAVLMLEHLASKGYIQKVLKKPSEVMPDARVPVYVMADKGQSLLGAYDKATEYKNALTQRAEPYINLHKKYTAPGVAKTPVGPKDVTKVPASKPSADPIDAAIEEVVGKSIPPVKSDEERMKELMQKAEEGLKQYKEQGKAPTTSGLKSGSVRIAKIRNVGGKWYLYSKDGKKKLGGPYKTRAQALKRMRQVEFFKHRKGNMKYKAIFRLHPEMKSKSAWLVYENDIPVMTVTAEQAFGESNKSNNEVIDNWKEFSSEDYGLKLVDIIELKGVDNTIKEEFAEHATKVAIKKAQVEKHVPINFSKNEVVRNIPTGKVGKVVDNKGEWYCVNYGDIIDYTMAELLEKVDSNELQTGHNRELAGDSPDRPQEYNITNQYNERIKDLPEQDKRDLKSGDVANVDRSKVKNPPLAHEGSKRQAQIPAPAGDMKVGVPPAAEPTQEAPVPTAAPAPAMVTPDVQQKMEGSEFPAALPISEVLLQILSSLIAASNEWNTAQALEELKNIFSNQRELDLFQGRLIEMVEYSKQRSRPSLVSRAYKALRQVTAGEAYPELRPYEEEQTSPDVPSVKAGDFLEFKLDPDNAVFAEVVRTPLEDESIPPGSAVIRYKTYDPATESHSEDEYTYKIGPETIAHKAEQMPPDRLKAMKEFVYKPVKPALEMVAKPPTVVEKPGEELMEDVEKRKQVLEGDEKMRQLIRSLEEGKKLIPLEEVISKAEEDFGPFSPEELAEVQKWQEEQKKQLRANLDILMPYRTISKRKCAELSVKVAELSDKVNTLSMANETLSKDRSELSKSTSDLSKENTELKKTNADLANKVTVMFKLPRAKRLAQKMMDCFITNSDQTSELLKLNDEQFNAKEHEVNEINRRIQAKLSQIEPPPAIDQDIITTLPGSLEQGEFGNILPPYSKKSGALLDSIWSRPSSGDKE